MKTRKSAIWMGIGMVSALMGVNPVLAGHFAGRNGKAASEIARDKQELHESRKEFRKDLKELRRDRMELRRHIRRGASDVAIARGRMEVRDSLREVAQSRRELGRARAELDRDLERYRRWERHGGTPDWSDHSPRHYGWRGDHTPWSRSRDGWWHWHHR